MANIETPKRIKHEYEETQFIAKCIHNEVRGDSWQDSLDRARSILDHNEAEYDKFTSKAFWESISDIGTGIGFDRTLADDYRLLATYVNDDVVHTCVQMNSSALAALDFGVYTDVEKPNTTISQKKYRIKKAPKPKRVSHWRRKDADTLQEFTDHPIFGLLENKTEDLDHQDMFRLTATYIGIFGKAYWQMLRENINETPEGIRVLKPWYVFPVRDIDGDVISYFYINIYGGGAGVPRNLTYERIPLEKENVIDFRWPGPSDPYASGDSPLRAAFLKVALNDKFTEWLNYVINNRARIDGVLNVMDTSAEVVKRVETDFNNKFKSGGNGGVLVVDGTKITFTPTTYAPTDLANLQIADAVKVAVANVLHIPPALVFPDPKYSNLENSKEQWLRGAILPLVQMMEAKINKHLMPLVDPSGDNFFAFDNPVPDDEEFALEQEKASNALFVACLTANPKAFAINEIRAKCQLEEWGEDRLAEIEDADTVTPPDNRGDDDTMDDANAGPDRYEEYNDPNQPGAAKNFNKLISLNKQVAKGIIPRAIAINLAERLGYDNAKDLVVYPIEKQKKPSCGCKSKAVKEETVHEKLKSATSAFFRELKRQALGVISKSTKDGISKDTGNLPTAFVDLQHWAKTLKNTENDLAFRVKPLIEVGIRETADGKRTVLERAGASPDAFTVLPQKINEYAAKRSLRLAETTLATTQQTVEDAIQSVKDAITDGIVEGDHIAALRQRISEVFDDAADWKSEEIARTENSAAIHIGQVAAAKASSIVKGFQYLVSADACEVCQDYSDQQIDLDDYDDSGTVDAVGAVPLHPNCTCTLEYLLNDNDEQDDTDNG